MPTAGGITRSPVAVTAKANFGGNVSARITSVTSVNGKANLPGEVAGPAVAVQITLTNSSTKKLALEAVVNLYSGPQLTPASSISGPPTKPFTDTLKAGSSARAVYTFTLATSQRSDVRVEFSYAPSAPVVLWDGPVG